jgi:O-antigen chain-terminating methyltransferase
MNSNSDSTQLKSSENEDFYLAFENCYRGSAELIQKRQAVYIPYINALKAFYPTLKVLDLGCGRGEWLGLLKKNGIDASGIDLDDAMLASCRQKQFDVKKYDALGALKELPDASLQVITGFHIAEHLPFTQLIELCKEAHRVLSAGGLLILETPNSENIHVASSTFHLDPTHDTPLPAKLLIFLFGFCGFSKSAQIGLNPDVEIDGVSHVSLQQVLMSGVCRDYAAIGQKAVTSEQMGAILNVVESKNIDSLESITNRFDLQLAQAYIQIQDQQKRITRLETPLRFLKKILSPFLKK